MVDSVYSAVRIESLYNTDTIHLYRVNKEVKSRFKSLNTFYHLVQDHLSSSLLSKNIKINFMLFCMGVKLGLILRE